MFLGIRTVKERKLIGKRLKMSLADNKTFELWSGFMPLRKQIHGQVSADLFSMQVYDSNYDFEHFDPAAHFEKWAAAEVENNTSVPDQMEAYTLPGGLYAVFLHQGPASDGEKTFRYIFGTWLPSSGYLLDNRPHFEILGAKYKNDSPDSEEEVFIPIRKID